MSREEATIAVEAMMVLDYMPKESAAKALIADELVRMCETTQEALWLIRRMSTLYGKWPGLHEMRAAYCAKYSPKDGHEVYSAAYIDGIPSEWRALPPLLDGPMTKQLEGEIAAEQGDARVLVEALSAQARMPKPAKDHVPDEEERRVHEMLLQIYGENR